MGLTIHYSLHSGTKSPRKARQLIEALRQKALDLPFKEVGEVIDLSGDDCDFERRERDDPQRWLLIQAGQHVERDGYGYCVLPKRVIAFSTWPGEGCEKANFGLALYPASIQAQRGRLRTGLAGWFWSSFCKTQYASNADRGGVPHFLRCHLSVVKMLDHARALGILGHVSDEGGFWDKRDVKALAQEVGEWNEFIAGKFEELWKLFGDGMESPVEQLKERKK